MALKSVLQLSILGFGYVGRQICSLLLNHTAQALHINILDPDLDVKGAFLDLAHAAELTAHTMTLNRQDLFTEANFIFHCAGGRVPKGASRLETCAESAAITKQIFKGISFKKEPFVIVLSNPVELITQLTQELTNLPKHKVFGTGTLLDSIRMNYLIKEENAALINVDAILLGEHGSTAFISEQLSSIEGKALNHYFSQSELNQLLTKVKQAADEIKSSQEATIYGVSYCAIKVFDIITSGKEEHLPLSTFFPVSWESFLHESDLVLSLLTIVSKDGVFPDKTYNPNTVEKRALEKSLKQLKACL